MPADYLEGQSLGKYRVLEPLGRGGMARVYRAYHPQLDRYVAIKVLRSDLVEEEDFLARFKREARAVAALRHPNIVRVFDFDVQQDVYYMVMELLEGDSLRTRLNDYRARSEQMPLGDVARILLDVLDGLQYAHGEGMVHRDVKPGNILLSRSGQAVLTDFGIAQIIGGTRYTVSGALMGTLNYMSPEQGLEGKCDARSDIYSLGIVLYEILTGDPPFDADTPLAILMKHVNDPLPSPRKIEPSIPRPLERVVLKSLAKRREQRYQSADEMAQALRKAVKKARIELPERISLPLSFTTTEAPSESVAVLSGTAREKVVDVEFAVEDTDANLGERLAAEAEAAGSQMSGYAGTAQPGPERDVKRIEADGASPAAKVVASRPKELPSHPPEEPAAVAKAALSGAGAALEEAANAWLAEVPQEELPAPGRRLARVIVYGIAWVVLGNLAVLLLSLVTRWWGVFGRGWPFELLLVGLALSLVTEATASVWMLIPTGIIVGNALLFSFYAITGWWRLWLVLWPLEPLLIGGVILFTIWLSGQGDRGRQVARYLARTIMRPLVIGFPIVVVLGAIFG